VRARVCRTCRTGHRHGDQRAAASRVFTGFLLLPGGLFPGGDATAAAAQLRAVPPGAHQVRPDCARVPALRSPRLALRRRDGAQAAPRAPQAANRGGSTGTTDRPCAARGATAGGDYQQKRGEKCSGHPGARRGRRSGPELR
jgi:hypothetical protein